MSDGLAFGHHARNDQWIAEDVFPGLRGGYFVEAGICAGLAGSASYVLERQLGWTGIGVEPVDSYHKLLVERRRCAADNRCLAAESAHDVEFLVYPGDRARSGMSASNKNAVKDGWAVKHGAVSQSVVKETVSLNDLLSHHGAPEVVHFLCLDVEGAEPEILGAFDFDGPRRVLAIAVESKHCHGMLVAAGYRQVRNRFVPSGAYEDEYYLHRSI